MKKSRAITLVPVFCLGLVLSTGAAEQFLIEAKKLSREEQAVVDKEPLGSEKNPIRCAHPEGERAYLDRLRCKSGERPEYKRTGSVGTGPYETIMDLYAVTCPNDSTTHKIYMDMYHDHVETRPVEGFHITPPSKKR